MDGSQQSSEWNGPLAPSPKSLEVLSRFTRLFGVIAMAGSVAALIASYNWIADLAAQLRVQYQIMLLPALILWTRRRQHGMVIAGGLAFAGNLWFVVPYVIPVTGQPSTTLGGFSNSPSSMRVLLLNVLRTNQQFTATMNEVRSHDADFVFLMEVSPDWKLILENARDQYPHQQHILREDYTGVAFLSKYPWLDIKVVDTNDANPPLDVSFPPLNGQSKPFRVLATHPLPPISPSLTTFRDNQLIVLAEQCRQSQPGLLIGDFNLTPWSPRFRTILNAGELTDAAFGHGLVPTLTPLPTIFGGLKVDHVLVTADINVDSYHVRPCVHSDHRMVIVNFNIKSARLPPKALKLSTTP